MNEKIYTMEEIKKYILKVLKKYGIEKAYIFGSYARGDYRENSDIDAAVVVSKKNISNNILKQMGQLVTLTRDISIDIEPVLLIEEDKSGFLENIMQYGEAVYSS